MIKVNRANISSVEVPEAHYYSKKVLTVYSPNGLRITSGFTDAITSVKFHRTQIDDLIAALNIMQEEIAFND